MTTLGRRDVLKVGALLPTLALPACNKSEAAEPAAKATTSASASALSASAPEVTDLRFGMIALTDCSPIVIAHEKGLFKKYGINSTIVKGASWAAIRDSLSNGDIQATHMLIGMPIASTMGQPGSFASMERRAMGRSSASRRATLRRSSSSCRGSGYSMDPIYRSARVRWTVGKAVAASPIGDQPLVLLMRSDPEQDDLLVFDEANGTETPA